MPADVGPKAVNSREAILCGRRLQGRYHGVCADARKTIRPGCASQQSGRELNSRLRSYFFLRVRAVGEVIHLTLLQFFLNHRRYRAAVKTRVESTRVPRSY